VRVMSSGEKRGSQSRIGTTLASARLSLGGTCTGIHQNNEDPVMSDRMKIDKRSNISYQDVGGVACGGNCMHTRTLSSTLLICTMVTHTLFIQILRSQSRS